ncbi:MAG TPA: hypothetical protein VGE34_04505 [Candidatus Saccharimonadales bacterium]
MQRSGSRFFPLFIVFIIIVLVVVAVVSIGRALFSGTQNATPAEVDKGQSELLKTDDGNSVRMTVRGPIVAEEDFKSYTITVSPDDRTMAIYKGYLEDVTKEKSLSNNTRAYEQFVYALDKANMMKGVVPEDDAKNDLRGICASGYIYEYSVLVNDDPVKRLWTSTCDGSKGSLQASTDQLNNLFFAQIPNARELVPFKSSGPRFSL